MAGLIRCIHYSLIHESAVGIEQCGGGGLTVTKGPPVLAVFRGFHVGPLAPVGLVPGGFVPIPIWPRSSPLCLGMRRMVAVAY
jgi:hypothetical protein